VDGRHEQRLRHRRRDTLDSFMQATLLGDLIVDPSLWALAWLRAAFADQ